MIIRNKCIKCKHKWRDQPGAFSVVTYNNENQRCPKCGSRYFKWSSYEFDRKKYPENFESDKY